MNFSIALSTFLAIVASNSMAVVSAQKRESSVRGARALIPAGPQMDGSGTCGVNDFGCESGEIAACYFKDDEYKTKCYEEGKELEGLVIGNTFGKGDKKMLVACSPCQCVPQIKNDSHFDIKSGKSDKDIQCPIVPTEEPSAAPSMVPSETPTSAPTGEPSAAPSMDPTLEPSAAPSMVPTETPTSAPTGEPSAAPSMDPTLEPSAAPSMVPSETPTSAPTDEPSAAPSMDPTLEPSAAPSMVPSETPTSAPSGEPSAGPTGDVCDITVVDAACDDDEVLVCVQKDDEDFVKQECEKDEDVSGVNVGTRLNDDKDDYFLVACGCCPPGSPVKSSKKSKKSKNNEDFGCPANV